MTIQLQDAKFDDFQSAARICRAAPDRAAANADESGEPHCGMY
jgi:hypothetical protein